jgi:hypothetical protein
VPSLPEERRERLGSASASTPLEKWSWHWAQSIRTPKNARVTRIASFSGSGFSLFSS